LAVAASITIVYGSVVALRQDDLKKRLAYSTVSQVSYIALGIAVGGALATVGGMVHLVHQGVMKITMFFCAGTFATLLGVTRIDQLDGLARRLPWSAGAFSVAALGMIGLPPLAGFVSKWYLGRRRRRDGADVGRGVLVASTLLNAAYFLPLIARMWLRPAPERWPAGRRRAAWWCSASSPRHSSRPSAPSPSASGRFVVQPAGLGDGDRAGVRPVTVAVAVVLPLLTALLATAAAGRLRSAGAWRHSPRRRCCAAAQPRARGLVVGAPRPAAGRRAVGRSVRGAHGRRLVASGVVRV
jgi:NADH:ubiquinone oxidoreductase subunit 5 (subunit L)/multisubunit Na+/H+ antiporter MnhA subunit